MSHDSSFNISEVIQQHVKNRSTQLAISIPRKWDDKSILLSDDLSFSDLGEMVGSLVAGLKDNGIKANDRVILLFPVSSPMIALMIAIFSIGAVPTFIDPGMGFKKAMKAAEAVAIVTIPKIVRMKWLFNALRKLKCFSYTPDSEKPLGSLQADFSGPWPILSSSGDREGIVTFTSGTSGLPKAANRTLSILQQQHHALSSVWVPKEGEVSMTCFPVSSLFYICHGATCILPAVDMKNPGQVNGNLVHQQMKDYSVSSLFGAPAFLEKLMDSIGVHEEKHPLETIVTGGAPTPYRLVDKIQELYPSGNNLVIYGSTEAEPIAYSPLNAMKSSFAGKGYFVGGIVDEANVLLIRSSSELIIAPPQDYLDSLKTAPYELGELIVSGGHVVEEYLNHPEANRNTKIRTKEGTLWHRTGDLAYFDLDGGLWLVGRDKDIIRFEGHSFSPSPIEAEIDLVSGVMRSAIISGEYKPVLFLELHANQEKEILVNIESILTRNKLNCEIKVIEKIPVDNRHNSKINRVQLKELLK